MSQPHEALFTRRTLLVALTFLFLFALVQYLQGRPAWCKYGLGFWTGAWDHCTSQHIFDPYTPSHVLHGVIFYWLLQPFAARLALHWRMIVALALEIAWELIENSAWVIERYRQHTASLDYFGDSRLNSLADVLATIAGFAFAARFSWKAAVAIFLVSELGTLITIRDNLTLNVLMLFFPIEALKQWQMGAA
jgi:hypothetical protein